jgi:D-aspartate ligase
MIRIGRKLNRPTILIPTDDLGAILVAEESATLRQWFIFPDMSAGTPRNLANKWMLGTLCRQIGVPCPNTRCPTSLSGVNGFAESARFPVIVIDTWASDGARTTGHQL